SVHSILLIRNGKLVVEEYFPGHDSSGNARTFNRDTLHELHSATKSVNSLIIGIAIDQGLIKSVDEKIASFFPEYANLFAADAGKAAISIKDCLSMTAGLSWNESLPYADPRNDHVAMNNTSDPIRYVLQRPLATKPGTHFLYNSGISIVLGEIIHKASGLRADEFARKYLFAPLGIRDFYWQRYPNQVVQAGGGLSLRPRDMARIGLLMLNDGRWRGKQIVSEPWVRESIRQEAPDLPYGYQWWLLGEPPRIAEAYGALGRGGQCIIVLPELQIVAVFTGWNDGPVFGGPPFDMLKRYILPAAAKPSGH
ncbi:MAG TPA: serine hydrolase, partial [Tepidisphaeraceae bacterium]|nr:serine hydrolase [Tepidisphaeraceae bacterium]